MAMLRDPDGGCAWDLEQDFGSIAPYTIEEAYEVDDAIRRGDLPALRDELGDLLLQVVFHARMAEERGAFDFDAVATAIVEKLVRRHPHVFESGGEGHSSEDQTRRWEVLKAEEREAKAAAEGREAGLFDDVPLSLPALLRAKKLQRRAGEKPSPTGARESCHEALSAIDRARSEAERRRALGELLFAVVALARTLGVDSEESLREFNATFCGESG